MFFYVQLLRIEPIVQSILQRYIFFKYYAQKGIFLLNKKFEGYEKYLAIW